MHRDLHNSQIMIHFPELDKYDDLELIEYKVRHLKYLFLAGDANFQVKIMDFGRAREAKEADLEFSVYSSELRGNKCPDLWLTDKYSFNVDVYNVGTIAYELATGKQYAFHSSNIVLDMVDNCDQLI